MNYCLFFRYDRIQQFCASIKDEKNDDENELSLKSKQKSEKKKVKQKKQSTSEPSTPTARRRKKSEDNEFSGFDESSTNDSRNAKRMKLINISQGDFSVYFEKHRESLLSEDPNLTDDAIQSKLQSRWRKMTIVQKARYKSLGEDSLKRKHSPSPDIETSSSGK